MSTSLESLTKALVLAGVGQDYAQEAAIILRTDIDRFAINQFSLGDVFSTPLGPVVEYNVGCASYTIEKARPREAPDFPPSAHAGTQLSTENILYFLRTTEIARLCIAEAWQNPDANFAGKMRSPNQHSDTLNEVWWLSRWKKGFSVVL